MLPREHKFSYRVDPFQKGGKNNFDLIVSTESVSLMHQSVETSAPTGPGIGGHNGA